MATFLFLTLNQKHMVLLLNKSKITFFIPRLQCFSFTSFLPFGIRLNLLLLLLSFLCPLETFENLLLCPTPIPQLPDFPNTGKYLKRIFLTVCPFLKALGLYIPRQCVVIQSDLISYIYCVLLLPSVGLFLALLPVAHFPFFLTGISLSKSLACLITSASQKT